MASSRTIVLTLLDARDDDIMSSSSSQLGSWRGPGAGLSSDRGVDGGWEVVEGALEMEGGPMGGREEPHFTINDVNVVRWADAV
jgi:hypothetical protein